MKMKKRILISMASLGILTCMSLAAWSVYANAPESSEDIPITGYSVSVPEETYSALGMSVQSTSGYVPDEAVKRVPNDATELIRSMSDDGNVFNQSYKYTDPETGKLRRMNETYTKRIDGNGSGKVNWLLSSNSSFVKDNIVLVNGEEYDMTNINAEELYRMALEYGTMRSITYGGPNNAGEYDCYLNGEFVGRGYLEGGTESPE